jgi:hypothetical protein
MEHTKHDLIAILERRLDALEGEHAALLDLLDQLLDDRDPDHQEPEPEVIEDKARWMRGARKEPSVLIREVEGPGRGTPRQ